MIEVTLETSTVPLHEGLNWTAHAILYLPLELPQLNPALGSQGAYLRSVPWHEEGSKYLHLPVVDSLSISIFTAGP